MTVDEIIRYKKAPVLYTRDGEHIVLETSTVQVTRDLRGQVIRVYRRKSEGHAAHLTQQYFCDGLTLATMQAAKMISYIMGEY
jgi:hypothetical protein